MASSSPSAVAVRVDTMVDAWGATQAELEAAQPWWRRVAGWRRAVSSAARPLTARSALLRRGSATPAVLVFDNVEDADGSDSAQTEHELVRVWGRGERARGLGALAATLAAAAVLVCLTHWVYGAADVRLLPLPLLLGGVGLVLIAGILSAVTVFRVKVAGRTGASAGAHQPAVFVALLLCGFALPVVESLLAEPGYLHPLLVRRRRHRPHAIVQFLCVPSTDHRCMTCEQWLVLLVGFHSRMLRVHWAVAATGLPLIAYVAGTLRGADGSSQGFTATARLLGTSFSSPAAAATAWLSLVAVTCGSLCISMVRSERSERDAWDHCMHVTAEENVAAVEEGRLEVVLGVMLPRPLVGRVKARGGRKRNGGVGTPLLHYHPHATIVVAQVSDWKEFTRPRGDAGSAVKVTAELNALYAAFDSVLRQQNRSAAQGGWEGIRCVKVQSSDGQYVAAVGAVTSTNSDLWPYPTSENAAVVACAVAQAFAAAAQRHAEETNEIVAAAGTIGGVHVAVHQGVAASGLIGAGPVTFDVWGPTVSAAKTLASSAPLHNVIVTEAVATAARRANEGREDHLWRFAAFAVDGEAGGFEAADGFATAAHRSAAAATAGTELFRLLAPNEVQAGSAEPVGVGTLGECGVERGCMELSVGVAGSCAFPGTNQWECLPPPHRGSLISEEGRRKGWENGNLVRFAEKPGAGRSGRCASGCRLFAPKFADAVWEQDYQAYESGRNRVVQGKFLSVTLVASTIGCWVWEIFVVGEQADDLTTVWLIYCWACAPLAVMLASLYTKLYKRSPGNTSTLACTMAAVGWAGLVATAPSRRGDIGCVGLLLLEIYALTSGICCSAKSAFRTGGLVVVMLSAAIFGRQQLHDAPATAGSEEETEAAAAIQQLSWALVASLVSLPLLLVGTLAALRRETARRLIYGWDRESEAAVLAAAGIGSGRRVETSRLLLLRVPAPVMRRIFAGERSLHDSYDQCAVLRVEVSGFDELCAAEEEEDAEDTDSQGEVLVTSGLIVALALLHDLAIIAEQLALRHGVVLLSVDGPRLTVASASIGGGTARPLPDEATALAEFALDLAENVAAWVSGRWGADEALALGIGLRQGLASGAAGGGLIGYDRFAYQLWGPAVSTASAMCEVAAVNSIACNDDIRAVLPSTVEEMVSIFPEGGAKCLFKFEDHRQSKMLQSQSPRARRVLSHPRLDYHTLIERDAVAISEAGENGRSSSTRSLVSVELGFSPTPTPSGAGRYSKTPHPPLPHSPDMSIVEEVDDMDEEAGVEATRSERQEPPNAIAEEISRPESTGGQPATGFTPVPPTQPKQPRMQAVPPPGSRSRAGRGRRSYASSRSSERPSSTGGNPVAVDEELEQIHLAQ